MSKPFCLVFFALLFTGFHVSKGDWVETQLHPSCNGTGFPNFSYGTDGGAGGRQPCLEATSAYISPPVIMTWYYYASYNASNPPVCGNPALPGGDQCCHTTANSTLTFSTMVIVDDLVNRVITGTGTVTAGAFAGHSFVQTFQMNLATVNLNCNKPYGQETMVGLVSTIITGGPTCLNGMSFVEQCPGSGPGLTLANLGNLANLANLG